MSRSRKDLTKGSIFKNLVFLSLPIMLSNFMQTLYNLIDTFWLGRLTGNAKEAVSSVGIAFPLVFFISAFGIGFMLAGTTIVAQLKGSGRTKRIKFIVGQYVIILALFSLLLVVIAVFLVDLILVFLNTPPEIFETTAGYIRLIITGLIFMMFFLAYQSVSHGLGDTVTPMVIQVVSLSLNLLIDPLLIFGFWQVPALGVKGAGYATLLSRIVGAIMAIIFFFKKNKELIPVLRHMKPNYFFLSKILKIGVPASISQSITSFGFLFLQGFVNSFGVVVISVYTIGNRMLGLFMMPAMGISNALTAIIGQNLGANRIKRAEKSVFQTFVLVMSIMSVGALLLFFYGQNMVKFFVDDPAVIEVGQRMFRVTSLSAHFFGLVFILTGVFNGAGQTTVTLSFNLARLWLFRIPLVYILSGKILEVFNINEGILRNFFLFLAGPMSQYPYEALWWSMLLSNFFASLMAFYFFVKGNWKTRKVV